MKKIASVVAAALITCSISACGNRNTAYRTPSTNQGGTNIGMNQGNYNAGVGNTVAFKDGVYLGEGNRTSMGNQAAIVTVSGGRITDVVLKTLDAQGREVYSQGANVGTNTGRVNNTTGTTIKSGTPAGTTTDGTVGNTITNGANTVRDTVTSSIERVRRDLSGAVVSQQTHNVTINSTGSDTAAVNNWKLAISKALETARK